MFYKGENIVNRLQVKTPDKRDYEIVLDKGFNGLTAEIERLELKGRKALVVSDTIVAPLYLDKLTEVLNASDIKVENIILPAGEESKNQDNAMKIQNLLIDGNYKRTDIMIALGGGVIGDISGYVSSVYHRGLIFIQIPTTLLSMVDSSVGGKNGVDYNGIKNVLGTFYNPALVYMNLEVLQTLDERQFFNGFAEAMKSAIIKDAIYYEWQIENMYEICDKDLDTLEELVLRSITIKKNVVEKDFYDTKGERALLNLGHTVGHAIESEKMGVLLHGECVALGTVAAAYISYKKQMLSLEEYLEIRDMFVPFNLPITVDTIDLDNVIGKIAKDKKQDNLGLAFVLLKKIGKAVVDRTVTKDEIMASLKELEYTDDYE